MSEHTTPRFDPERLKTERGEVDLGAEEETEYQGDPDAVRPHGANYDPVDEPTSGPIPPAR